MTWILGVDIGNTNTVFGLFDEGPELEVPRHWRTVTRRERTPDELGIFLLGFLQSAGIDPKSISGMIYSSVVPSFNPILERMAAGYFHCTPVRVSHDKNIPLEITYPRPFEIGADRLVNAVAADRIYGGNLIVVDSGTATTFCIVEEGRYRGGIIGPGLYLSMEALFRNTAQLPSVEFAKPPCGVIGDSTVHAIQSGFYYGWKGLLREILREIRQANQALQYRTVATGGLAGVIQREAPELFDIVDSMLTLKGLKTIYRSTKG